MRCRKVLRACWAAETSSTFLETGKKYSPLDAAGTVETASVAACPGTTDACATTATGLAVWVFKAAAVTHRHDFVVTRVLQQLVVQRVNYFPVAFEYLQKNTVVKRQHAR